MPLINLKYFLLLIVSIQQVLAKPSEIVAEDGNKYLLERNEQYNWFEALLQCTSRNLRLATLDNEEKTTALVNVLKTGGSNRIWINAIDSSASGKRKFYWTTGAEFVYTNWKQNEPNGNGEENCIHMDWTEYKWNDNNCARNKLGYICEENPLIANPKKEVNRLTEFLCDWGILDCPEVLWSK